MPDIFRLVFPLALFTEAGGDSGLVSFLDLALALALIIGAAKLGGYASVRLKQPAVLGELIVGLILGPSLLDFLHWGVFEYTRLFTYEDLVLEIDQLAEIGVLTLMFIAGLELHLSDLAKSRKVAIFAGTLGVIFPLVLGFGAGRFFAFSGNEAFFIGLVLSATSVSISAQTLMEMNRLRTRVGISLLGAAVLDDILVILGLSIFFAVISGGGGGVLEIGVIVLRMIAYLTFALGFGILILPKLTNRIEKMPISRGLLAFVFVMILLYAWLAEVLGNMAPITGAFIAGLMFARTLQKERIEAQVSTIAYGIFVPIFFVSVGLEANLRNLTISALGVFLVMTVVAIVGKVLGAGIGARMSGFNNQESLQVGVGMMSRGEVGLIVAAQGIAQGLIVGEIFSAIVGVVIVTTILTPLVLRYLFTLKPKTDRQPAEA